MVQIIPVNNSPARQITTIFNQVDNQAIPNTVFSTKWNPVSRTWTLDLADGEAALVCGLKVLPDIDLVRAYPAIKSRFQNQDIRAVDLTPLSYQSPDRLGTETILALTEPISRQTPFVSQISVTEDDVPNVHRQVIRLGRRRFFKQDNPAAIFWNTNPNANPGIRIINGLIDDPQNNPRFFGTFSIFETNVLLNFGDSPDTAPRIQADFDLSSRFEEEGTIQIDVEDRSLIMRLDLFDTAAPYAFRPTNFDEVQDFYNIFREREARNLRATITLRDYDPRDFVFEAVTNLPAYPVPPQQYVNPSLFQVL